VRTRESILAKHYGPDSLMLAGCVGEPRCRVLLDTLLTSLEPLKLLPFSLDLMFEMRELHRSFKRIESDMRAASRVSNNFNLISLFNVLSDIVLIDFIVGKYITKVMYLSSIIHNCHRT
jgi:hypothetical protein